MKTNTASFTELTHRTAQPTLVDIDGLLSAAKSTVPADAFPELKLGKTYRFTANVMREYGVSAMEQYAATVGTSEAVAQLNEAFSHLREMLDTDVYIVNETFAKVLRSELYKLRNAVKELSPMYVGEPASK